MILVLLTLMSDQPLVHDLCRLRGRQSGRKCGDVYDYLSDHGMRWIIMLTHTFNGENVRRPLEIDIEAPVPGGWN